MIDFSSQQPWGIPDHWEWSKVANLGEVVSGGTPSTKVPEYWNGRINWLSPADLSGYQKKYIASGAKSLSRLGLANSSARLMPKGSVLYSSRAPVGYVAIASDDLATNQGFKSLVPADGLDSEYLYYYFKASKRLAESRASGTTFKEISGKAFAGLPVPIAPAPQQRRIVAKIEELFSELDKGIESLRTARAQLKTYRQSLLKAAFEGRLTEQWRRENADKLEPADQLLARIRKEREARYQQQLEDWNAEVEKWEAEGKPVKKPTKPSLPKVEATDASDDVEDQFSLLPDSWAWIRLGNAAVESVLGKMLDKKKNRGILKPYLRNINVRWGRFDLDDLLEMRFEDHEQIRYGLADGDLAICEGGEPGRCAVWKDSFSDDMRIQKALHRIRLPRNSVLPEYVQIYFEYAAMTQRLERYMTGTTIKHLTGKGLNQVPIPVCSVEEQRVILELLSARFSNIDHTDRNIGITLQQAETLRQSILKRAFEGKLVPQDPDDEPAAELLARIHTEKLSLAQNKHERRASRRRVKKKSV